MVWFGEREESVARRRERIKMETKIPILSLFPCFLIEGVVHQVDGEIDEEANYGERDYMKR